MSIIYAYVSVQCTKISKKYVYHVFMTHIAFAALATFRDCELAGKT